MAASELGLSCEVRGKMTDCSSGDWYFTNPGPVFMSRTKLYKRVSIKSKCKKKKNPRRNFFTHETPTGHSFRIKLQFGSVGFSGF